MTTPRIPPFDEAAEMGLLGAVVLDPERVVRMLAGKIKLRPEEFYGSQHRVLWEQVSAMHAAGRHIDLLTLSSWLSDRGLTDLAGGSTYIERLVESCPTPAHAEYYAEIVREKAALRRIVDAAREVLDQAYDPGERKAQDILARAMSGMEKIGHDVLAEDRSNVEVFDDCFASWQRAHDARENGEEFMPGLVTPYRRYNEIMGGMQPGLHFFGGKSSAGKTTFVLNIIRHFLLNGHGGLMVQLDDTHEDVIGRMCAMMAGVSLPALSQGFAKRGAMTKLREEIRPIIQAMKLHVVEECVDMREAAALAHYHKGKNGIEWMVIDYVQVLDADGNPRDDERIRLGKIASACKRLWKQLRIPLMVVSQTSKFKDADDDGRRADMSDLFGASELFHAATSVMILKAIRTREGRGEPLLPLTMPIDETGHTHKQAVAGHIVKNKHGPKDCMTMLWALLKYFQVEETKTIRSGGINRQMTWEDEIEAANASSSSANKPPEWAPED